MVKISDHLTHNVIFRTSFIHACHSYLLKPGAILSAEDKTANKRKSMSLLNLHCGEGDLKKNDQFKKSICMSSKIIYEAKAQ